MQGFEYRKSLKGSEDAGVLYFIGDNSVSFIIGDAVKVDTNGHATTASAGNKLAGIVAQVVDKNGIAIDPDSATTNTYTMASDNETVAQKKVGIIFSKDALFANVASAALAVTNLLQFFDLTDKNTVNTSSASDTAGQMQLVGLDPDGDGDTTKGLFRIAESQFDPYAQQ